jgi:hypothetical protein
VGGDGEPVAVAVRPVVEARRRGSTAGRPGLDGRQANDRRRGGVRIRVRKGGVAGRGGGRAARLSYGLPWAHYLGEYQDRLLGGPLGLPDLCRTVPDGVRRKDYSGEVLG